MTAPRRAIVLAAGRGERMRPLTDTTPKPLLQAGGRPLIEYHLHDLAAAGITEVVVNLAWLGAQLRAALGDGARFGLTIHYSDEGPEALETGGGIFRALRWLGPEPFLVVNGDIYSDYPLGRLRLEAGLLGKLVLVPNPEQHPRGDFHLAASGLITAGDPRHTYSGIGIYHPDLFAGCTDGRFPLKPLLDRAIEAGRLGGELHAGHWTDVGTPQRLAALDQYLRA